MDCPTVSTPVQVIFVINLFTGDNVPSAFSGPSNAAPALKKVRKSKRPKRRQTYHESTESDNDSTEEVPVTTSSKKRPKKKKKRRTTDSDDDDPESDLEWAPPPPVEHSRRKLDPSRKRKLARVESDYDSDVPLVQPRKRRKRKKSKKQRQAELEAEKRRKQRQADEYPVVSDEALERDFALLGSLKFYSGFKPKEKVLVDQNNGSLGTEESSRKEGPKGGNVEEKFDVVVVKPGKMEVDDDEQESVQKPDDAEDESKSALKDVIFTFEQREALEYLQKVRYLNKCLFGKFIQCCHYFPCLCMPLICEYFVCNEKPIFGANVLRSSRFAT